ncbi:MAG TPA: 16S rRNA (guanine(527)-N(7))-methyltransferase RsmG [Bryobacteraceae bacterium]|nr:16S rRNA (guanine(527)-N(7))-methyltransferase RsmG [Bryobacteraceae bacterium]
MEFRRELDELLPQDLPERQRVVDLGARHLRLVEEANRQFNLTRILSPREAAIKHVVDSVLPWRHFAGTKHIVDAGTGAGFPGIPLALVLPGIRFTLAESIGKKARFVESAVDELGLRNVEVLSRRAEEILVTMRPGLITARAVAPIGRFAAVFASAIRNGSVALLYKGPDAEAEIADAVPELRKAKLKAKVVETSNLPDAAGVRTLVALTPAGGNKA